MQPSLYSGEAKMNRSDWTLYTGINIAGVLLLLYVKFCTAMYGVAPLQIPAVAATLLALSAGLGMLISVIWLSYVYEKWAPSALMDKAAQLEEAHG